MSYLAKTPEGLLPCPHCGGEAEARDGSSTRPYIRCKSCGCRTGASYDMDKLKEAWNRRSDTTCEQRRTRRTCRYVRDHMGVAGNWFSRCSECGAEFDERVVDRHFVYCPNCGARVVDE